MRINPSKPLPDMALSDLKRIDNGSIYALTGNFICSRGALLKASEGFPVITDDNPTLEFTAPISHWAEDTTAEVEMRRQFLEITEPIDSLFTGEVDWETARKFNTSRKLINRGFYEERTGNITGANKLYEQALRDNPDDIKAKRSLLTFMRKFNRLDKLSQDLKKYYTRPSEK